MLINQVNRRSVVVLSAICAFAAILIMAATYQITAKAGSVSWVAGGEPTLRDNSERSINLNPQKCHSQILSINDRVGLKYYESGSTTACVYERGNWRYALTNRTYKDTYMDERDVSFAIGIGADARIYRVNNLPSQDIPIHVPNSKGLVYANEGVGYGRKLKIYKDITKRLLKVDANTYAISGVDSPDFVFKRSNGDLLPVEKVASSDNGKWLVFEAIDLGIMRLNLETYEITRVSSFAPQRGLSPMPQMSLAISNDGNHLAMAGEHTPFKIYNITDDCGDTVITDGMSGYTPVAKPCLENNLGQYLGSVLPSGLAVANSLVFSADASEIGFIARRNNDPGHQDVKEYVIQAPGFTATPRLDYLAMGDSYSSGEGDTQVVNGKKYYLPGTDVEGDEKTPREKCHISSRSYPFLLQGMMEIPDKNMKSVACSGAEVRSDYRSIDRNTADYKGQGTRLAGYEKDITQLQAEALRVFSPGRLKQLEFIKQYKPQSITLTGGGNDVGFGNVIESCIMSNVYPCAYNATEPGRAMIGQGIANQYYELTKLFAEIRNISPATKIYMVGYPQFVDSKSFFCAPNVPLSKTERAMINEAVTYLNQVIESAADSSGVKYIDIEDSLKGHKLCESGASYVTGLALARKLGFGSSLIGKSEEQESFHPNRSGHKLIANAIMEELNSQSLLNYVNYPTSSGYQQLVRPVDPPEYFAEAMKNVQKQYRKENVALRDHIQKVPPLNTINIRTGNFKPNSLVKVEIHSEPVDLGIYTSDELGGLSIDVPLPFNVPAGYHTLHLIGASYSGEEIDVWQRIEVRGSVGDIDEDGISDDVDQCMYVAESGLDDDSDGTDDACDPMIEHEDRHNTDNDVDPAVAKYERQVSTAAQIIQAIDVSSAETVKVKNPIEDVFYLPSGSENIRPIADGHQMPLVQLVLGIFASSLVLYWIITRYSNHTDV